MFFFGAFLLSLPLIIKCTTTPVAGSETTNGLTIAVVNGFVSGNTLPNNRVMCFSSSFNPDSNTGFIDTTYTDSLGNFSFTLSLDQHYNLFTYSSNGDSCALIQDLKENILDTTVNFCPVLNVEGITTNNATPVYNAKVYIIGTSFKTISDQDGRFSFISIPDGNFVVKSVSGNWTKGELTGYGTISREPSRGHILTIELK
jgi:hypothetical protein